MDIKLIPPLRDIYVTQPFGVNYLDFYKKLGLAGHNGIDFLAYTGCAVTAAHNGVVVLAGTDGDGGIGIELLSQKTGEGYKTIYYHLKSIAVMVGNMVKAGQVIGIADNTGKYTTGDHLHFGLKPTFNGNTQTYDNGFNGALDPAKYFPADWELPPVRKFYGRKRVLADEVRIMTALTKYLKRLPSWEQINACTYGNWDREAVANPAMRQLWAYMTKIEYQAGRRPFR